MIACAVQTAGYVELTAPQAKLLRFVASARRQGEVRAAGDPVLQALGRRDMLVAQDFPANPSKRRWVATMAGRAWIAWDDARQGFARPVPLSQKDTATPTAGSRWTLEQLTTLAREGIDDPECCPTATITQRAAANEDDWTQPPRTVRLTLPRLAITRDSRRAKLVTPAGAVRWMDIVRG